MKRAWSEYAIAGLALVVLVAGAATLLIAPSSRPAVWFGAGLAYAVQLAAFAILLLVKDNPQLFVMGWIGGMVVRFVTVGMTVLLLVRTEFLPKRPTMLSLIGFVFVLTILEPLFLRRVRATP